jgi:GTPase SAR1 family protein
MIVDLKYTKTKNIPLFKAVMVGDSEVGKTTLLNAISVKLK